MTANIKTAVFWNGMSCSPYMATNVLEELVASVFRTEVYVKMETAGLPDMLVTICQTTSIPPQKISLHISPQFHIMFNTVS